MYKSILLIAVLFLLSCKVQPEATSKTTTTTKPPAKEDTTECTTDGYVKDFTGLDGCKLMILVGDEKWLPTKFPKGQATLQAKQIIKFGYREVTDAMSICMAEDKMVEITCIQVQGGNKGKPDKVKCVDTTEPKQVEWMKNLIRKYQPIDISKFPFRGDGWAYLFRTNTGQLLYTCQGNLVCESNFDKKSDCHQTYIQYLRDRKVIYHGEGNH